MDFSFVKMSNVNAIISDMNHLCDMQINVLRNIRSMYSLSFGQCILCHSANVFSVIRSMYSLSFGQCILCHSDYPFVIFKLFLLCIVMSDRSRNDIDLTK